MLIKREKKENLIESLYSSSTILASKYDADSKELIITFKNGGNYSYANVSESDYMRFETAESQGVILNSVIKKYPFTKLGVFDTNLLTEEINTIKESEYQKLVSDKMNIIIDMCKYINDNTPTDKFDAVAKEMIISCQSYLDTLENKR